jgi:hypothetical protein
VTLSLSVVGCGKQLLLAELGTAGGLA